MYDYKIVSQAGELKPNAINNMDNDTLSVGINEDFKRLASENIDLFNAGWEIVSHDILFYQEKQLLSLLLRRQRR